MWNVEKYVEGDSGVGGYTSASSTALTTVDGGSGAGNTTTNSYSYEKQSDTNGYTNGSTVAGGTTAVFIVRATGDPSNTTATELSTTYSNQTSIYGTTGGADGTTINNNGSYRVDRPSQNTDTQLSDSTSSQVTLNTTTYDKVTSVSPNRTYQTTSRYSLWTMTDTTTTDASSSTHATRTAVTTTNTITTIFIPQTFATGYSGGLFYTFPDLAYGTGPGYSVAVPDEDYVSSVYGTTTTAASQYGWKIILDYVALGTNDWAWSITMQDGGTGIYDLSEIADSVNGSQWSAAQTIASDAQSGEDSAQSHQNAGYSIAGETYSYNQTVFVQSIRTRSGNNPGNGYYKIPTPDDQTWTESYMTTSIAYTAVLSPGTGTAPVIGQGTAVGPGITSADVVTLYNTTMVPCVGIGQHGLGVDPNSAQSMIQYSFTANAQYVSSPALLSTDSSSTKSYDYANTALQGGESFSSEGNAFSTSSYYDSVPIAGSNIGAATYFGVTYNTALRFGTTGKCDRIVGAGQVVYYPFFSQVSSNLWMPMTYPGTQTATWVGEHTDSTVDYNGNEQTFYAAGTGADGSPLVTTSMTFSWGDYSNGQCAVTITNGWSVNAGTTTTLSTTSTSFLMQSANDNEVFYTTASNYYGQYQQIPGYTQTNPPLAVGGAQPNDSPVTVWLDRGIWDMTINYSGGNSTTQSMKLDQLSTLVVPTSEVHAYFPRPYWTVGFARGDGYYGANVVGVGNQLITFNKWQYN